MSNSKTLNARFQLKYDSYQNWKDKNPTLLAGELAIAKLVDDVTIPVNEQKSAPVLFKVGPGAFNDLPWASGLAADVYSWAKQTEEDFIEWMNEKVVHPADTDLDTRYSFEIKDGKLVVNATTYTLGVAGTPAKVAELELATDAEIAAALENYYTKTEVDALLKEIRDSIGAIDTGVMSVSGKDAIEATGDDAVTVSLKIAEGERKFGDVTLTQDANGLKAEYALDTDLAEFGISKDTDGNKLAYVTNLGVTGEAGISKLSVSGSATIQGEAVATQKYVGEQIEAAVEDLAVKNVSDTAVDKQFVTAIGLDEDGNVVATREAIDGSDIADAVGTYGITKGEDGKVGIIADTLTAAGAISGSDVLTGTLTALSDATFAASAKKVETIDGISNTYEVATERFATAAATTAEANAAADATTKANQALVDAKAYVDEEDKFYNGITTVNALGGIAANTSLDNKTTHEILDMLLFPYVAFSITNSSRNAAAATLENGATQTLSSCSITVAKKSKPITSITLYNGSSVLETKTGDAVANGGTITFNGFDAITVSKSNNPNLKFTVTDGQTSTDRNVGASTFVYPYYWGVCAPDATVDEALIEGLTKSISSKGNKTDVSFTCANQKQVFAYPKAHGVLKSIIDPNNFEIIGDFTRSELSITGLDGTAQTYYVYVSGACSVTDFKIDFKY